MRCLNYIRMGCREIEQSSSPFRLQFTQFTTLFAGGSPAPPRNHQASGVIERGKRPGCRLAQGSSHHGPGAKGRGKYQARREGRLRVTCIALERKGVAPGPIVGDAGCGRACGKWTRGIFPLLSRNEFPSCERSDLLTACSGDHRCIARRRQLKNPGASGGPGRTRRR